MTKYKTFLLAGFALIVLWVIRAAITQTPYYFFIVANVGLAVIPVLLAPAFDAVWQSMRGLARYALSFGLAGLWLLFLPNAFYLLTDFMHLNSSVAVNARDNIYHSSIHYGRGDTLYIYDSLFLTVATVVGAYAGGLALVLAYRFFIRQHSAWIAGGLIGLIMVLSAAGVYIGRFGRWNSWDGLVHPWRVGADVLQSLTDPAQSQRFVLVLLTMLLFEVLSFTCVYINQKRLK